MCGVPGRVKILAQAARTLPLASVPIHLGDGLEPGRNRCQFLFTLPISVTVGALYGYEVASQQGWEATFGVFGGMGGLTIFVYLQLLLEPGVVGWFAGDSGRFDTLVAFVWDAVTGAVVGLPLFWYLGVEPLPAFAAAATMGAAYGYVMGWVVCGEGVDVMTSTVLGGGPGRQRKADYSQIETLEARGDYESARVAYQKILDADPAQLTVAIRQARLMSGKMDQPKEAVALIRRTLGLRKHAPRNWAFAVRMITEICATKLGSELIALPDFARFLEAHPEGPDAEWARQRMAGMKESIE